MADNIDSLITGIETSKGDIATAIEGKGVTVPANTKLAGLASLVNQIPVMHGPATSVDGDLAVFVGTGGDTLGDSGIKAQVQGATSTISMPNTATLEIGASGQRVIISNNDGIPSGAQQVYHYIRDSYTNGNYNYFYYFPRKTGILAITDDISGKAEDSDVVHLGASSSPSNETIYGSKSLGGTLYIGAYSAGAMGFLPEGSISSTYLTSFNIDSNRNLTLSAKGYNTTASGFSFKDYYTVGSTTYTTTYTFPNRTTENKSYVIATTDDIPTNIENGTTTGSLQQVFDGSTFSFVNPNSPLGGTTVNIGIATGTYATMLGGKGRVEGKRSFVNGTQVIATGNYAHAEGNNTHASGVNSHTEGIQTYASGSASHAEGSSTAATETGAHSEGYGTHADGVYTHTEGSTNYALGDNSHAEGGSNIVGVYSGPSPTPTPGPAPTPETAVHPEGMGSHAEGNNNTITGAYSHAEGQGNTISSNRAHAEGNGNTVSGLYAHAEGNSGVASGEGAHSEGLYGHAVGNYSHAEGAATYANGLYSHAAGQDSTANGIASFVSGFHVTANRDYQTVFGKYNLGQADTLLEVGNGNGISGDPKERSNAFEVYKDGHATIGSMGSTNLSIVTKQYVDDKDSNLVHKGTLSSPSNETIYGTKTFNSKQIIGSSSLSSPTAVLDVGKTSYGGGFTFYSAGTSNGGYLEGQFNGSLSSFPYVKDVSRIIFHQGYGGTHAADTYSITLTSTSQPTGNRTITLPNNTGTVALTSDLPQIIDLRGL